MADVERYLCIVRLGGTGRFFLWERADAPPDRVVLDDAGLILAFTSDVAARDVAGNGGLAVDAEEAWLYDLDAIQTWCESSDGVRDCSELLNAWNLFGDLPRGESLFAAADTRANLLYDKVFHGCNLPAMTPPGAHYTPIWTSSETAALKHLLLLGLAEFRARLR